MNTLNTHHFPTHKEITNLESFIQRQNEIQKQVEAGVIKGGRHMKFLESILDFQKVLTLFYGKLIDPITFLHTLYFEENQSFETIRSTIKNMYEKSHQEQKIFFTASAIQKFAKDRLNWKLKNQHDNKNTFTYRAREIKPNLKKLRDTQQEKKEIDFLNWFIQNTQNINMTMYNEDKIAQYQYMYEKLIYILKYVYGIKKNNFLQLKNLGFGTPFIAIKMKKIFQENKISFPITEQIVRRVFINIDTYDTI